MLYFLHSQLVHCWSSLFVILFVLYGYEHVCVNLETPELNFLGDKQTWLNPICLHFLHCGSHRGLTCDWFISAVHSWPWQLLFSHLCLNLYNLGSSSNVRDPEGERSSDSCSCSHVNTLLSTFQSASRLLCCCGWCEAMEGFLEDVPMLNRDTCTFTHSAAYLQSRFWHGWKELFDGAAFVPHLPFELASQVVSCT